MTSRIISGNRSADDITRSYLERLAQIPSPGTPLPTPPVPPVVSILEKRNGFYTFDKPALLAATTPAYRSLLKDGGYADIDSCSGLHVAEGILKYDDAVKQIGTNVGLSLTGNNGDYVVNINQSDGIRLVEGMGYTLLTTQLMYSLFIPYIKTAAKQGDAQAQTTLDEMVKTKAEWLQDVIFDKTKLKIGNRANTSTHDVLVLPTKDGRFNPTDMNEYGYPTQLTDNGEFYYWFPRSDEVAAVRSWGAGLSLVLVGGPSFADGGLGVRLAKFF